MSNELIILIVGVAIGLACTALGGMLGGWLGHRARNNLSPLPKLPSARRLIDVVTRRKRPLTPVKGQIVMKKMRS